ncbi:type VI secretion system tip protein TssI/VgrG [Sorangium sp. So ce134]
MGFIELTAGGVTLDAHHVQGRVALSELFSFHARASKEADPPAVRDLLGKPFALTLRDGFERALAVHGVVVAVERTPTARGGAAYALALAPEVAPLAVGRDQRCFQQMDVIDVLKKVLDQAGVPASSARWSTRRSYTKRPYWAQYHESDWAFVERLLAEEGIYYWFDFTGDATVLVFADDSTAAPAIEGDAQVPFRAGVGLRAERDAVTRVTRASTLAPDAVRLRDYDFNKPRLLLDARAGEGPLELYDFPGRFRAPEDGARRAQAELEARRARRVQIRGYTGSLRFRPGLVFELVEHPLAALGGRLLLDTVSLTAGESDSPVVSWAAIPAATPFRTPRVTCATRTPGGPQTGVVVGASGQEIHPDATGRVRVQLHWDRQGRRDDAASTWMRVGQFPLGGSMMLPRVGWDVLVHHHEGDIDDPFVLTHLYDGQHPAPYRLPADKTRTAWQTATTPGGGSTNEIRFDDKKGAEEVFINASKDMNVVIGDTKQDKVGVDHAHRVGANLETTVGGKLATGVVSSQSVSIGASETLGVASDRQISVGGGESAAVGGSRTVTVSSGATLEATAGRSLTVGGSMLAASALAVSRMALGSMSVTVGGSWITAAATGLANMTGGAAAETVGGAKIHVGASGCETSVKGAFAETVGGAYVIAAGKSAGESSTGALAITVGGAFLANAPSIEIEAESEISIRCGAASVTITSSSVEVKAPSLASPGATITKKAPQIHHN